MLPRKDGNSSGDRRPDLAANLPGGKFPAERLRGTKCRRTGDLTTASEAMTGLIRGMDVKAVCTRHTHAVVGARRHKRILA